MNLNRLYQKALNLEWLSASEGKTLFLHAPLPEIMHIARILRQQHNPTNVVTWLIDRNVNITNVCFSQCKFCNFYCKYGAPQAYITTREQYAQKVEELFALQGDQLLLQGGLHPKLGLDFYVDLFSWLKKQYPKLRLHALGPPEIVHISRKAKLSYRETLEKLVEAGLDSLPGAGAEILTDRVRKIISPAKCTANQWFEVMRQAHKIGLITSATMMFGHIETIDDRIEHLLRVREVQSQKPDHTPGFLAFIPWTFQAKATLLEKQSQHISPATYVRMIALSRILLPNIKHIQASWLTVGKDTGQLCLHAGADDFGSIMIEENVVSAAGASYKFDAAGIQKAIAQAGFLPRQRNQKYEWKS